MRVSPVAGLVRISALAAAVAIPMLAACSNDPLSPTAQTSRASNSTARRDTAVVANSGGTIPWFDAAPKSSGGTIPWF